MTNKTKEIDISFKTKYALCLSISSILLSFIYKLINPEGNTWFLICILVSIWIVYRTNRKVKITNNILTIGKKFYPMSNVKIKKSNELYNLTFDGKSIEQITFMHNNYKYISDIYNKRSSI